MGLIDNNIRAQLFLVSSLLRQGKRLDTLTNLLVFMSIALMFLILPRFGDIWLILLTLITLIITVISKYYAMRVLFDSKVFNYIACQHAICGTQQLDGILQELGLLKKQKVDRSWSERSKGAINLLKRQAFWCVIHIVVVMTSIIRVGFIVRSYVL